jgi:peptidoglycan hydrolase-like protein with peptidoglycan-binding domain
MSNLFKSKFLLGVMVVTVMFGAFAFFSNAKTAAADCSITSTLRVGSTGTQVVCLQTALGGLTLDGVFGPKTRAAVVAWQSKSGLVADGIFGPKSNAVWVANQGNVGVFPAGCQSASGYSSTTGYPCYAAPANTFAPSGCTSASGYSPVTGGACYVVGANPPATGFTPAGCTSANGYSPVTGGACQSLNLPAGCTSTAGFSPTTGGSCSGTFVPVVSATGEGSITLDYTAIPASGVVINKGLADQNAAGITIKATGSDMKVSHVWLDFTGYRPWLAADTATLKDGSTVLGTVALSASTMTEVTAGTKWELQFNGLNVVVPVGTTKTLMLTLGRPTLTNSYGDLTIAATSNVRATDMAGYSNTYVMATRVISLPVTASSNGTLTATVSATSPLAQSVTGLSTVAGTYTAVKLLAFDLKATNGPINITALSGTITNAGTCSDTGTSSNCIASTELRDPSGNVLASVTGANVFSFTNLNVNIATGATATYSIWVQAKDVNSGSVVAGDNLFAVVNSITATSGPDYATASCTTACTATGTIQYFYQYAPTITLGATTATASNSSGVISGDYSIAFTVTAPAGQTIYVDYTVAGSGNDIVAEKVGSGGGSIADSTPMTASSTSGTDGGTWGFIVLAGQSRTFTVYSHIPNGGAAYAGVKITKITWNTVDSATGAILQTWGLGDFHTANLYLTL